MDPFSAAFLGLIQGITEFLPISSTGHLIIARDILGLQTNTGLAFDAVLHLATALAVLIYFRREILDILRGRNKTLLYALILGTIPAVAIGLLFGGYIEEATRSPHIVAWMLLVGSALFVVAEVIGKKTSKLSSGRGFGIGLYQALALAPGISRSGASISGAMLFGLNREFSARFAFILSLPILLGVGLLKLYQLGADGLLTNLGPPLAIGSVFAFLVGLLAIHFMIRFLRRFPLYIFAAYRVLLALVVFLAF